jgi:transposase-like protein
MGTSEQPPLRHETTRPPKSQRQLLEEKRRIIEETLAAYAAVARRHAVNTNQVFYWRKKYREGRLGKAQSSKLQQRLRATQRIRRGEGIVGAFPSPGQRYLIAAESG